MGSSEKIREDRSGVKLTLLNRAKDTREDLVSMGALAGAVAATDLASHDARAEGVFGAPMVASMTSGFRRNVKTAGNSIARWAANRRARCAPLGDR